MVQVAIVPDNCTDSQEDYSHSVSLPAQWIVLQGSPGDGMANTIDTINELIEDDRTPSTWRDCCRNREDEWRRDYSLQQCQSSCHHDASCMHIGTCTSCTADDNWYKTQQNLLGLFPASFLDDDKTQLFGLPKHSPKQGLPPGSTFTATECVTVANTAPYLVLSRTRSSLPPPRQGTVQFLKVSQTHRCAYTLYSIDGYSYARPCGDNNTTSTTTTTTTADNNQSIVSLDCYDNWWRVHCMEGAYLRGGVDLGSPHKTTLPYGTLLRVLAKTTNAMGLSRLHVQAPNGTIGWCSEQFNPLSGQRGNICVAVPFPVPALFEITLDQGAVIRHGPELSSAVRGRLDLGTRVSVTGCTLVDTVQRLRLAGHAGWISRQLYHYPHADVCKPIGPDPSFDPLHPERYHRKAIEDSNKRADVPNSTEMLATDTDQKTTRTATKTHSSRRSIDADDDRCIICLCESRTAVLVHGNTGHICCCLVCANVLKLQNAPCPVCRSPIDSVVKHFWA